MKLNLKVRFKNPYFWMGLISAMGAPVLAYFGLTTADLTTWAGLWELVKSFASNPYLIGSTVLTGLTFVGIFNDPTTKGLSDSAQALKYTEPKSEIDVTKL